MKKTILAAAGAALLLAGTGAAQASSASALSLNSGSRAATAVGESNEVRGGFIIPLVGLIAIILGIIVLSDGDGHPDSP